jgi:hypothetical protein
MKKQNTQLIMMDRDNATICIATYFSATDMSLSSSSSLEMLWADAMLMSSLVDAVLSFWLGDDRSSVLLLEPDLPI